MKNRHLRRSASVLAAAFSLTAMFQCVATASASESTTTVKYRGLSIQVPVGWNLVDLAKDPQACVRLDQHTVYLGHPGANQSCPTHLIAAKTEALVLEPFTGATSAGCAYGERPGRLTCTRCAPGLRRS